MEVEERESLLLVASASSNPYTKTETMREFNESLVCNICGWDGNKNRIRHDDPLLLIAYVEGWVIAGLKHRLRHIFYGSFRASRQFTPKRFRKLSGMKPAPYPGHARNYACTFMPLFIENNGIAIPNPNLPTRAAAPVRRQRPRSDSQ